MQTHYVLLYQANLDIQTYLPKRLSGLKFPRDRLRRLRPARSRDGDAERELFERERDLRFDRKSPRSDGSADGVLLPANERTHLKKIINLPYGWLEKPNAS